MFPPRRILAAVDFSEPSRTALTMAARLALYGGAELHILHAEDPLLCAAARMQGVTLSAQARDELNAFVAATSLPSTVAVHLHVIGGEAVGVIWNVARREQADVIVIGTHGMSSAERLVFGSTAEGVLRRSDIPVLLVPPAWSPPAPGAVDLSGVGPVVAGVDFTGASLEALGMAFRLARMLDTRLELVHVVPELPVIARWRSHADQSVARRMEEARAELARLARGLTMGVSVTTEVVNGPVAECIAQAAHAGDGRQPLLVLGRRRAREHGDAPGSTAYRVLSLAQVPTLMFMAGETVG
jgi:nucleotide-binding universal stress UspA family protein